MTITTISVWSSLLVFYILLNKTIKTGAKVDSQYYCDRILGQDLLPDWDVAVTSGRCRRTARLLTRPETRCVTCSMKMCSRPTLNRTRGHRIAQIWNPVDYAILGTLQQMIYHRQSFVSVDELKRAIVETWQQLLQSFIDESVGEWRHRL